MFFVECAPVRLRAGRGLGVFRPRASDFLAGQKVTKEPSKGRGISISPFPWKTHPLKTTNQGAAAPYWMYPRGMVRPVPPHM